MTFEGPNAHAKSGQGHPLARSQGCRTAPLSTHGAEDTVIEAMRDIARWLYRQLRQEYEHLTSDEAINETLAANQWTFTGGGEHFG